MDAATILIAFGLAMDSFSVSITNGLARRPFRLNDALKMAAFFGSFQAMMPIIGWLTGVSVIAFISGFDHWLAFGLLTLVGARMIYESFKDEARKLVGSLSLSVLLLLSVATSIDALAVGLSFSLVGVSIWAPAIVIGTITFLLSFLGGCIGDRFGRLLGKRIEIVGGLILIVIGLRVLMEHWLAI